ncbi:MAG: TfoX/Sxy family DNA transformation protein [Pseudomonadales bacterium]|nr:TfoX/Sxy family DNA transformation protein [Pseudomonadales bacterium]
MAESPLAQLPSLGPASAAALADVGIRDEVALREAGVGGAFALLRAQFGKRITVNWIYALECALRHLDWRLLEPERKAALRAEAGAIIAALEGR